MIIDMIFVAFELSGFFSVLVFEYLLIDCLLKSQAKGKSSYLLMTTFWASVSVVALLDFWGVLS